MLRSRDKREIAGRRKLGEHVNEEMGSPAAPGSARGGYKKKKKVVDSRAETVSAPGWDE